MNSIFKKPFETTTKPKPKSKSKSKPKPAASETPLPPPTYATRPPKGTVPTVVEPDEQTVTIIPQPNRPGREPKLQPPVEEEEEEEEETYGLLPPEWGRPVYQYPFEDVNEEVPSPHEAHRGRHPRTDEHSHAAFDPHVESHGRLERLSHLFHPSPVSGPGYENFNRGSPCFDSRHMDPRHMDPRQMDPHHPNPRQMHPHQMDPRHMDPPQMDLRRMGPRQIDPRHHLTYGPISRDDQVQNERQLALMTLNPHCHEPETSSGNALARAVAIAPSSAVTVFRNPDSPADDIIALPKFAPVPYSMISASNLSAITSIFNVTPQKVSDWCKIGLIERDNRTQALKMDAVFALFDSTYRARWEVRIREDSMGITAQREHEEAQRNAHEHNLAVAQQKVLQQQLDFLTNQQESSRARSRERVKLELEQARESVRQKSKERKKDEERRKEKDRKREKQLKLERENERDQAKEKERARDRELKLALALAKKNNTPAPAPAPAAAPMIINNQQPAQRERSRSRTRIIVSHPRCHYGYWGGRYYPGFSDWW